MHEQGLTSCMEQDKITGHIQMEQLVGLVADVIECINGECRVYFRKEDGLVPCRCMVLHDCFYVKDFGIINSSVTGYRIVDLGVKLFGIAESLNANPDDFKELHLWSDVKSMSRYANYECTGLTAAFRTFEVVHL